ncbi:uncharacterized protein CDAR_494201 [Caerostris darwini]|uniref:Gem-associated protein 2 n=1 Tax=Caerostris darwini TaxID=1538125 RepID=A0AAV4TL14_9ARAC|nr:uncharacterized protein CDAR_494201 [Caerostris darwini]
MVIVKDIVRKIPGKLKDFFFLEMESGLVFVDDGIIFKCVRRIPRSTNPEEDPAFNTIHSDEDALLNLIDLFRSEDESDEENSSDTTTDPALTNLTQEKTRKFTDMAMKLHRNKEALKFKFPKPDEVPKNGEKEWCMYCLGTELYLAIYKDNSNSAFGNGFSEGHLPLIPNVIHLSQDTLMTLLRYYHKWFLALGMNDDLCRWVYAILACLKKPLNKNAMGVLDRFYNDCEKHMKNCIEKEKERTALIHGILTDYFSVSFYKIQACIGELQSLANELLSDE